MIGLSCLGSEFLCHVLLLSPGRTRPQNKNVSACRNRPRRFRLPTVGTITIGRQGWSEAQSKKVFQALRNLENFFAALDGQWLLCDCPGLSGRDTSFSRSRRAVCNTFPSPQQLRQDDYCVTLTCILLGGMSKFFLTFTKKKGGKACPRRACLSPEAVVRCHRVPNGRRLVTPFLEKGGAVCASRYISGGLPLRLL